MRTSALLIAALLVVPALAAENELTDQEKQDGWVLLFNGKDLTGWKGGTGWKLDQDSLALLDPGKGGMIWADEQYGDFDLKVEYKFDAKDTNSGVFFRTANKGDCVQTGFEMQVLSDTGGQPGKYSNGALYDAAPATRNTTKPIGEWNLAEIVARGSTITISMNGAKIVDIDLNDWKDAGKNPDGSNNKFKTAYKDMARKGFIGMQDHGGKVWCRNIKIKPLKEEVK